MPSPPLTDPNERNLRIRFFTREVCPRRRKDGRSSVAAAGDVSGFRGSEPIGPHFSDLRPPEHLSRTADQCRGTRQSLRRNPMTDGANVGSRGVKDLPKSKVVLKLRLVDLFALLYHVLDPAIA